MDYNYILEWFCYGDRDLLVAEHSLSLQPQPYEIICYLCQQSAEKYMKGFLFYHGVKPPKTHDLEKLCNICVEYNEKFDNMYDQCETLSQYGVQPHYPYGMELDEYQMKKALDYAQQIKEFEPIISIRKITEQALKQETDVEEIADSTVTQEENIEEIIE